MAMTSIELRNARTAQYVAKALGKEVVVRELPQSAIEMQEAFKARYAAKNAEVKPTVETVEAKPVLVQRSTRMTSAIARAKEVRPMVKLISSSATEYAYSVTSSKGDDSYTVKLTKGADNKCYATCGCKANQFGNLCFHVASATALQIAIVSMRDRA